MELAIIFCLMGGLTLLSVLLLAIACGKLKNEIDSMPKDNEWYWPTAVTPEAKVILQEKLKSLANPGSNVLFTQKEEAELLEVLGMPVTPESRAQLRKWARLELKKVK